MVFRLGIFAVLIAAVLLVVGFGYSILNQGRTVAQQAAAPAAPPPTEQVLTAAGNLPGGALIQPNNLGDGTVVIANAPPGVLVDTPQNRAALTGSMVRQPVTAGTQLTNDMVIHPGDHGFLAAVLAPGMRAVTVAVDNVTGANGLIWPGDNVDVLLTQTISGAPDSKSIAAEVVLSNVRVIATGAELIKDATAGPNGGQPASTVTLEVTPEQAARCLVAINLGKLSLIVHSAQGVQASNNGAQAPAPAPVWAGQVSPALSAAQPSEAPVTTVNVISAGSSGEFKF